MTARARARSWGEKIRTARRGGTVGGLLLPAGIAAVAVYAVGDVLCGFLYNGYRFRDQAISELSAYGSPVRPLMVAVITAHGLLLGVFGVGVWRSAHRSRALRWAAGLLIASVVVTLPLHPFFPMSSRWMEGGFNDTMHIVLTMVFSLLVFGAVGCSAAAFPGRFRLYAIGSLLVIGVSGGLAGNAMRDIGEGLPTPWVGAFERANAYVYFAWIVVLAVMLMRRTLAGSGPELDRGSDAVDRPLVAAPRL